MPSDGEAKARQFCKHVVRQSLGTIRVARLEFAESTLIIENVMIRRHQAGDDRLTKPLRRVNHDRLPVAADWIGGEHHASHLGVDHPLDDDRDSELRGVDLDPAAVGDGSLAPE